MVTVTESVAYELVPSLVSAMSQAAYVPSSSPVITRFEDRCSKGQRMPGAIRHQLNTINSVTACSFKLHGG